MMYSPYFFPPQYQGRGVKVGNQGGGRNQGKSNAPRNVRSQNPNNNNNPQQQKYRNPTPMEVQQQQVLAYKNQFAHRLYEKIIMMGETPEFSSALTGAVINSEDFKVETSEELLLDDTKLKEFIKKYKSIREPNVNQ